MHLRRADRQHAVHARGPLPQIPAGTNSEDCSTAVGWLGRGVGELQGEFVRLGLLDRNHDAADSGDLLLALLVPPNPQRDDKGHRSDRHAASTDRGAYPIHAVT